MGGWGGWQSHSELISLQNIKLWCGEEGKVRLTRAVCDRTTHSVDWTGVTSTAGPSLAGDEYVRLLW